MQGSEWDCGELNHVSSTREECIMLCSFPQQIHTSIESSETKAYFYLYIPNASSTATFMLPKSYGAMILGSWDQSR